MHPKLLALSVAAPLALGAALVPTAAHADPAGLPATDSLFTIECDSGPGGSVAPLQLFSVNASTGALATIGSGDAGTPDGDNCAGRASQDPTSGRVYFVDYARDRDSLSYIDPSTGTTEVVDVFTRADGADALFTVWAFTIDSSGSAFATDGTAIFSVDLDTAELTVIGDGVSGVAGTLNALAAEPGTGQLYGINSNATVPNLYTIDPETGEATALAPITQRYVYGFAFDSSGWAWIARYDPTSGDTKLGTVDVGDWAATYTDVAPLRLPGAPDYDFYIESLFITSTAWPEVPTGDGDGASDGGTGGPADGGAESTDDDVRAAPELAKTGASTEVAFSLFGAAVLAFGAGAGLLLVQRRERALA